MCSRILKLLAHEKIVDLSIGVMFSNQVFSGCNCVIILHFHIGLLVVWSNLTDRRESTKIKNKIIPVSCVY